MKKCIFLLMGLLPVIGLTQEIIKPETLKPKPVVDNYHGQRLEDPYRYLENMKDEKVINWMKANTNYAEAILNAIPEKDEMLKKMKEMDSRMAANISNLNITRNDMYYYLKTRPEDQVGKLYFRKGYEGEEVLLLDPEEYKTDSGNKYAISSIIPDRLGNRVAVVLAPDGSENGELLVMDQSGKKIGEVLNLVDGADWGASENSIYYLKLNSADVSDVNRQMNMKIYRHEIGTPQSSDEVFFSSSKYPELGIEPEEIPILLYDRDLDMHIGLVLTVDKSLKMYLNNKNLDGEWKQLSSQDDKISNFSTTEDAIYYMSFKDAPNFKILKASKAKPEVTHAEAFIPEPEIGPIDNFGITSDGIYYTVKSNGVETKLFSKSLGRDLPKEIKLPKTAGTAGLSVKGPQHDDVWVYLTGWTTPGERYKYQASSNEFIKQPMSTEVEYPELDDIVVKEVNVTSHDGVKVPVSIIHNKNIKMDGSTPAVMYGYGSYGSSTGPFFSPLVLIQTLYGGMFVVPHVRGGGELGDAWHRAGQKQNKPNTWKDAIATAEYLIDNGYTSKDKLSFFGGSAGGILVGRAVTERPDLFAAVAPMVGAMNTVRMEESPNGPVNAPEFGTVKDPEEFKALLEMDSYHHLEDGTEYPAMLVTSGMNDPRVIAWEPAKFAARAQAANTSEEPILLLTEFDSGHGMGDTKDQRFERFANVLSFFYWHSGHPKFQPPKDLID